MERQWKCQECLDYYAKERLEREGFRKEEQCTERGKGEPGMDSSIGNIGRNWKGGSENGV
jgi:hypothetical protein